MAEESKELAKIQNNWYEILELEYYPVPEENEKRIEARIEEKKRHWLAKESDPFDGEKYKKYNNGINIRNTNKLYFLMFFHIVSGNAELIKLYRLAVFEG